jgi:hypothetical protein
MNKATIMAIILLAVIAGGALLVNREMNKAQARPAVQRQLSLTRLAQFVEAIKSIREERGAWPATMKEILHQARLPVSSTAIRGAGIYRYKQPAADAPADTIIIWSDRPYDGVAVGEPYGGEGQFATEAIPPLAYVVTSALTIETLSPEVWVQRIPQQIPSSDASEPVVVPKSE